MSRGDRARREDDDHIRKRTVGVKSDSKVPQTRQESERKAITVNDTRRPSPVLLLGRYVLYFYVAIDDVVQTLIDRRFDPAVLIGGDHNFSDLEHGEAQLKMDDKHENEDENEPPKP